MEHQPPEGQAVSRDNTQKKTQAWQLKVRHTILEHRCDTHTHTNRWMWAQNNPLIPADCWCTDYPTYALTHPGQGQTTDT